jgi:hypothetical protein
MDNTLKKLLFLGIILLGLSFSGMSQGKQTKNNVAPNCKEAAKISVDPNPFKDILRVDLLTNSAQNFNLKIRNYLNRILIVRPLKNSTNQHHIKTKKISSKGIYLISITNEASAEIYHETINTMPTNTSQILYS